MSIVKKRAAKWVEKHQKTDINFDIRLYDNRRYMVKFNMEVTADTISKLAEWFLKRKGINKSIELNEFSVDERLYGKVLKGFRKAIDDVEKNTAEDINGFRFLNVSIKDFKYKKKNKEKYEVVLKIEGDFTLSE